MRRERRKGEAMFVIREWEDAFADDYVRLSLEWLEKYVRVEAADEAVMYHPHESVLNIGGAIWFAAENGVNVGTVSMIPIGEGEYELAKLAVTESCKGRGAGSLLMQTAMAFAERVGARRVMLFTNSRLRPAIHLYEKFGFVHMPLGDSEFDTADVRMEAVLQK